MAYSPRFTPDAVTARDDALVETLLQAIGSTGRLSQEDAVNLFTALTGPVPGFVAACAAAIARHAGTAGVPPEIADRAIRQPFAAAGGMLTDDPKTPQQQVQKMIDDAGTTAAGLTVLRDGPFTEALSKAHSTATDKARTIAS